MSNNKKSPMLSCTLPSRTWGKTQRKTIVSNKDYNTGSSDSVKTCAKCAAREAEEKALKLSLEFLKRAGYMGIQQLDWIAQKDGKWEVFEIKQKELFEPGLNFPYWGAGLDKRQLYLRTQLLKDKGVRTYLIVFAKGTDKVYGAYLDELERGEFYDTPNGIRIYPIDNYKVIHNAPNQNLGELGDG